MKKCILKAALASLSAIIFGSSSNASIVLTFEGLGNEEPIKSYYSGGSGGFGSTSNENYGITFGSNALAIIDSDAGGSGNFGGEPSPSTAMFFLNGTSILNMPAGFDKGFSFSYSSINHPASVVVYDGLNASGNALATVDLPVTPSDGGDPNGSFSPFFDVGVPIEGIARSIDFGGTVNQVAFDDITFGSVTPGQEFDFPFLVGDETTNPGFDSKLTEIFVGSDKFDVNAPTYIVTHGWQPSENYEDADWNFDTQEAPEGQLAVIQAIVSRLEENGKNANIFQFEWEGAYTGGLTGGSKKARENADYAGVLLGASIRDALGDEYSGDIHFIGHSYGTILNGLSTRYLDSEGYLDELQKVQFTVLDAPTSDIFNGAPNFDADWFNNNLSNKVDYIDNYFGTNSLTAFGEPIEGSGFDQPVDYNHGEVWSKFYVDLISNGPNAKTNGGFGSDSGKYQHLFKDWITPALSTFDGRPEGDFVQDLGGLAILAVNSTFEKAIGTPIIVTELPNYTSYSFLGVLLQEQSPVSSYMNLDIPSDAQLMLFDWLVGAGGDGDWITVYFEEELLWTMLIDDLQLDILNNAIIDISNLAGLSGRLFVTLNSVNDKNAEFYFGNVEYLGFFSEVPEPGMVVIFSIGVLLVVRRRRNILEHMR